MLWRRDKCQEGLSGTDPQMTRAPSPVMGCYLGQVISVAQPLFVCAMRPPVDLMYEGPRVEWPRVW